MSVTARPRAAVGDGSATEPQGSRRLRRRGSSALLIVVATVRLIFASDRRTFHVVPDEAAIMGIGRWLSGTGPWNMLGANTWRPGASFVLVPFFWITDDPVWLIRCAYALNALVAGLAAVVLAKLLVRLTDCRFREAIVVAGLVSLMPAGLSASAHAWAEPLTSLVFLTAIMLALRAVDDPGRKHWTLCIVVSGLGFFVHGRLLALLVASVAVAVGHALAAQRWRHALQFALVGAAMYAVTDLLSRWVFTNVWEAPGPENSVGTTLGRLGKPFAVLDALAGQVWYLLVSTALVAGFGLVVLITTALTGRSAVGLDRHHARTVLFLLIPSLLTSAVFMSDRTRPDHIVYGRYNDAAMPLAIGIGAIWLARRPLGRGAPAQRFNTFVIVGLAMLAIELGLLVRQLHHRQLTAPGGVKPMIAGIAPFMGRGWDVSVLAASVFGLLLFAIVVGLTHFVRSGNMLTGGAIVIIVVLGGLTHRAYDPDLNALESAAAVTSALPLLTDDDPVGFGFVPAIAEPSVAPTFQLVYVLTYQWYLGDVEIRNDIGLDDDVGPYVFAPTNDLLLGSAGGELVWTDLERSYGLWREPDEPVPLSQD